MKRIVITLSAVLLVVSVVAAAFVGPGAPAAPAVRAAAVRRRPVNLPACADGRDAADDVRGDHRARADVRLDAVAAGRQGTVGLPLRGEGILRLRHGQRSAVQDAPGRAPAGDRASVQRARACGVDARQRRGAHVRVHRDYTMASGHAAVEILTTGPAQFVQHEPGALQGSAGRWRHRPSEILAQVGALVRTGRPLGGSKVRKMVLAGTSMSAGTLINYLPAHVVFRTPEMQRIYDGFYADVERRDHTRTWTCRSCTCRRCTKWRRRTSPVAQDSDEPGKQYRLYRVRGHGAHRHALQRAHEAEPLRAADERVPAQAYVAVGLHHLLQWVDKGTEPPRAERICPRQRRAERRLAHGARRARESARRHPDALR